MLVTVKDGVATEIRGDPDHPNTGGVLCTKVSRYLERTYHPDRLLYPMKRTGKKGEGKTGFGLVVTEEDDDKQ